MIIMAIKLDPKDHYAYYKRSKSYENKEKSAWP